MRALNSRLGPQLGFLDSNRLRIQNLDHRCPGLRPGRAAPGILPGEDLRQRLDHIVRPRAQGRHKMALEPFRGNRQNRSKKLCAGRQHVLGALRAELVLPGLRGELHPG